MTTERRCRSWRIRALWPRRCNHHASHDPGGKWHHAPSGHIWYVRSYWK